MWKCKKCGCTEFLEHFTGEQEIIFDKNGEVEEYDNQEINTEYIECVNCGYSAGLGSNNIKKIANWVEEE